MVFAGLPHPAASRSSPRHGWPSSDRPSDCALISTYPLHLTVVAMCLMLLSFDLSRINTCMETPAVFYTKIRQHENPNFLIKTFLFLKEMKQ